MRNALSRELRDFVKGALIANHFRQQIDVLFVMS